MAITGIIGIGFVVTHMIGNLKVYLGVIIEGDERAYDIDIYGEFLRDLLVPLLPRTYFLWGLRLVLIGALVLHLHAAYSLTMLNRKARPVKYQTARDYQVANFASRTMRWTGIIVAAVPGLAPRRPHVGLRQPRLRPRRRVPQPRRRRCRGCRWRSSTSLANIALGIHLFHGTWSLFQSLGWSNPRFNKWRQGLAAGLATVIVVGNCSIPIAVQAGIIDFDPDAITCCVEQTEAGS